MVQRLRPFAELVAEAEAADVTGWGFDWLDGRATEERPPWGYARLPAQRLAEVDSAVDLDTGGGEVLAEAPVLPPRTCAVEAWGPNARRAQALLGPRGVRVVPTAAELPAGAFALVSSRHPVAPDWAGIARLLAPGGRYLGQHVGPRSAFELIEWFLGPVAGTARDPEQEAADAHAAGLEVVDLRTARLRMEFHDVDAVVWILRKCVWWAPDFSAARYADRLREMRFPFVAHSTRHLVECRARPGQQNGAAP